MSQGEKRKNPPGVCRGGWGCSAVYANAYPTSPEQQQQEVVVVRIMRGMYLGGFRGASQTDRVKARFCRRRAVAQPMEEVEFSRDVRAILIPDGYEVPVARGTGGWITQVLGGNYTVQIETGRLVRVASRDADAIGKEPMRRVAPVARPDGEVDLEQLWGALKECYDPEIPLNIVEIGLVYDVRLSKHDAGHRVEVDMTLTAPGCGMGQVLADDVERAMLGIPGVFEAQIELVFDPPWTPERMSEAGRLELGMFF